MSNYRHFFGFDREPFGQELRIEELYPLQGLKAFTERFEYAVELGLITVLTGDVGTGKSTSLRYALSKLHPSEYRVVKIVATSGTILDVLRQICLEFGVQEKLHSVALMGRTIRQMLSDIVSKKQQPVIVMDESHLIRHEVFSELHAVLQIDLDSRPLSPVILSGQKHLIDTLMYHTCRPFASRVVGRTYLEALKLKDMRGYVNHHVSIAGVQQEVFSEEAIVAIHQSSAGLLRRANNLARGALMAACREQTQVVAAEHVRIASTETI